MLHFDFNWDLNPDCLIFDEELNLAKLGWVNGDYFKLVEDTDTGVRKLVKVNELEKFILKGNKNVRS
jgi:hypothetical protein